MSSNAAGLDDGYRILELYGGNKRVDNIVHMNHVQSLFPDIGAATGNKRLFASRTVHQLVDTRLG